MMGTLETTSGTILLTICKHKKFAQESTRKQVARFKSVSKLKTEVEVV